MSKVIADGEEVSFDGDYPTDPSHVYELLMGALSEQGRVAVKFIVDGEDAVAKGEFPESFQEIEVLSLSHDELTLRLIVESMDQMGSLEPEFTAYARNILTTPWSEVIKRMQEFIKKVEPFADLLDNLGPYAQTYEPPWGPTITDLSVRQAESLGVILKSFEQSNPTCLSDELMVNFIPIFKQTQKLFKDSVVPFLEEKVKGSS